MKLEKEPRITQLVPKLIETSNGLSKEIKKRIKLNHIFSEFEAKATNHFNFFIKESNKRYLCSKYGANMEYLIARSQKRGQKEAYKILNDNFYLNQDILKERKKLQKRSTNEIHQNITDIISRIKGLKKGKMRQRNLKKNLKENLEPSQTEYKNKLEKNKRDLNRIIARDEKKLTNSFNKYKNILTNIKPIVTEKTYMTEKTEENEKVVNNRIKKQIFISFPNIQLLNYTKAFSPVKTKREEDRENRINLQTLIPYGHSGKNIFSKNKELCLINPLLDNKNKDDFIKNCTNTIVVQRACNEFNSVKRFNMKKKQISKRLGLGKMPKLTYYETILNDNYQNEQNIDKKKRIYNLLYNEQKYLGLNAKEVLNSKIEENLNNLDNYEVHFQKNTIPI